MALTQTDLDNLDAAIAAAELEVQLEGRRVRYRSTEELLLARKHVADVLSSQGGSAGAGARRSAYRFNLTPQRGW